MYTVLRICRPIIKEIILIFFMGSQYYNYNNNTSTHKLCSLQAIIIITCSINYMYMYHYRGIYNYNVSIIIIIKVHRIKGMHVCNIYVSYPAAHYHWLVIAYSITPLHAYHTLTLIIRSFAYH